MIISMEIISTFYIADLIVAAFVLGSLLLLVGSVLLITLGFCVMLLCFACLRPVSCVPIVTSVPVSLDCPL